MIGAHQVQDLLPQGRFEWVSDITATAAVFSPWWLPLLKETSEISAMLLPFLGVLWLLVQIGFKFYNHFKNRTQA